MRSDGTISMLDDFLQVIIICIVLLLYSEKMDFYNLIKIIKLGFFMILILVFTEFSLGMASIHHNNYFGIVQRDTRWCINEMFASQLTIIVQ